MPQTDNDSARRDRGARIVMKAAGRAHRLLYRISGGRIGGTLQRVPVLLLTTTGRKSGKQRTWPLGYLEDGEDLIVIASAGGVANHPAWYLNLRAHPEVTVQVGNRERRMLADIAGPAERARWWERIVARYPFFADYQTRTEREIPVVRLSPPESTRRKTAHDSQGARATEPRAGRSRGARRKHRRR